MRTARLLYLLSILFAFVIPSFIEAYFVLYRIPLINFVAFALSVTFLGALWDIWAIRHGKRDSVWIWQFNQKYTLGVVFLHLPIEEYLFFFSGAAYLILLWEGIKYTLETGNLTLFVVIPLLGIWTLAAMLIPYTLHTKNDRI